MRASLGPRLRGCCVLLTLLILCGGTSARGDMIQSLVDQVSEARLAEYIGNLEFRRYTAAELDLAADYITAELESFGYTVTEQPFEYSKNLIARLDGTSDPESIFVVGAHYDTVSSTYGADDNASGVAGMLEVARILAGRNLPYTIEFVAWSLEELGLWGSYHYVDLALAEGKEIFGVVNFEMIGYACHTPGCQVPVNDIPGCFWVDPDGVNVGGYGAVSVNAASAHLRTDAIFAVDNYVPGFEIVTMLVLGAGECAGGGWNFTRRSDHVPFWEAGIPAIEFFDTYNLRNPVYHTWNDTLASLDMEFCRRNVQTGLAVVLLNQDVSSGMAEQPTAPVPATLRGAFPNPFNPWTRISFELAEAGPVALRVYDLAGKRVRTLVDGSAEAGVRSVDWNGRDDDGRRLASGVYLIRMESEHGAQSSKVALIR